MSQPVAGAAERAGRIGEVADNPTDPLGDLAPPLERTTAGDPERRDRRRALLRLVAIVVVVGLAIAFVVQNLHPVTVHLWVTQRRLGLVWVIAGCLVVGLAVGYWVGWQGHRQAVVRRAERATRGGRRRRAA
ncbi:MAG: hypothetical protein M0Z63_06700 [Actinomycetota bacterium]|jgi:uncharacterized integral membrane protein|nr:hypothetical protein [Actinomycetota bacterium]